ncbi:hypothetical protein CAPTEDRAFT_5310 [Capitella teleta]|uniref:G-protein coupled receptors family 1 profile domain-containing protein n=1 Tax=Capitella teleta TaxID=283909 RepID=N1PB07_CAPTE|nr:hypothetical protein CAPTEDRAFT_5310 [Capitella teleta]|eukprot:ELU18833.1 hypothetical protein CAPTEDRAFT_5310 [Capitella teleta]
MDYNGLHKGPCFDRDLCMQEVLEYMRPKASGWILILLYGMIFVIGLVGNFLVCFAVWRNPSMRTVTNYFIVNLALADFLVILICLPSTVIEDVAMTWFFGRIMCKIVKYLQAVSVAVSVFTLSCISLERFYAICYPLSFKSTPRRAKVMIVVTWVLALLMAIPDLICLDTQHNSGLPADFSLLTTCKPTWSHSIQVGVQCFNLLVMYLLPLGFMFCTYFRIVRCLWSNNIPTESSRDQLHSNGSNSAAENQLRGRRNAAKMLIAVVVMFCICYLPVHLLNILGYANALDLIGDYITLLALMSHWLSYLNSAINPVIYNYMSMPIAPSAQFACKYIT